MKKNNILSAIGPGLLFASSAIGTSHLVLSTRAGAHHGLIFIWIILAALILKYPFFEFGPRYANATGVSILNGYKAQGKWAIYLFAFIIFISMFAVTGAVSAVSAGLLGTIIGLDMKNMPYIVAGLMLLTGSLLVIGRYKILDSLIKIISVVLLVSISIAFFAVLWKGPVTPVTDFTPNNNLLEGTGLILLVSLIGWMPSGMEVSAMSSIWTVEKIKSANYHPTLKESNFDFNLGYIFTTILAILFLVIGANTVYGTGELLTGNASQFSNKLLQIFVANLGEWAFPVLGITAFLTIYGTLITAWDAFARSFVASLRVIKFSTLTDNAEQQKFVNKFYNLLLPIIGIGGFLLFTQFTGQMVALLEVATIISFLAAPIIAFLNLKAIKSDIIPSSHRPPKWMIILSYIGLVVMTIFTLYYIWYLTQNGH